ncbi:MAG TPA: MFS transporter [candidate division Zixibacteria bacterium]|nr:MFS transporter [candidate division Zixibacteria bacterium]
MRWGTVIAESRARLKGFFPAFMIVVNSFVWYSVVGSVVFTKIVGKLQSAGMSSLVLFGFFYAGIAISALAGAMLVRGYRRPYLLAWMLAGTVASLTLVFAEMASYPIAVGISFFLGISIGFGLPSCLAYFADATNIENRGLLGGISYGVSGLGILALFYMLSTADLVVATLILAIWRCIGFAVSFFTIQNNELEQEQKVPRYSSILNLKIVRLYLAAWIMFCLVNWTEAPLIQRVFGSSYDMIVSFEFALSGIFAFVAGPIADHFGRKRVVIAGFVMLGIEYAALSLFSGIVTSGWLFAILDGTSWGMFAVVFFMVLWGDIGENKRKEKYYVIGGLPYLLAGYLSVLIMPYVDTIVLARALTTAFSLASFFLFLAVVPLMYAPEPLPEKRLRELELRSYLEKAKEAKAKYT